MHCQMDELICLYDSLLYDVKMKERKEGVVVKPQTSRSLVEGVALRLMLAYRRICQNPEEVNAELNQCKSRLSLDSDLVLENELVRRVDANSIPALMQTEQEYRRVYQSKLE